MKNYFFHPQKNYFETFFHKIKVGSYIIVIFQTTVSQIVHEYYYYLIHVCNMMHQNDAIARDLIEEK